MIRYVRVPRRPPAGSLLSRCYEQIRTDFGLLAEPLLLHAPAPELLAGAWCALRETLVADGVVPRAEKEAIALAVSRANQCPYCVDAHSIMLAAAGSDSAVESSRVSHLTHWALTGEQEQPLGLSPEESAEIRGTALCFQYINPMVTIFLGETPLPLRLGWLRKPMIRVSARYLAKNFAKAKAPGRSAELLPNAELSQRLEWAQPSSHVATALAQWTCAILEVAGKVHDALSGLDGVPDGSDAALDLARETLGDPHRIGAAAVNRFRAEHPEDQNLVAVLAWASLVRALERTPPIA